MTDPSASERGGVERRNVHRARALLSGKIIIGDGRMTADCIIHNLSTSGAHVRLSRNVELPRAVGLLLVKEATLFDATVIWRGGDKTGLMFHARHDLLHDRDPSRRGARALWAELAPR
jgi:hypothetical protein